MYPPTKSAPVKIFTMLCLEVYRYLYTSPYDYDTLCTTHLQYIKVYPLNLKLKPKLVFRKCTLTGGTLRCNEYKTRFQNIDKNYTTYLDVFVGDHIHIGMTMTGDHFNLFRISSSTWWRDFIRLIKVLAHNQEAYANEEDHSISPPLSKLTIKEDYLIVECNT